MLNMSQGQQLICDLIYVLSEGMKNGEIYIRIAVQYGDKSKDPKDIYK